MKFFSLFLFLSSLLMAFTVSAELDDAEKLKQTLAKNMPTVKISKISTTPIDGLYEVIVGPQIVYMSADARYMIEGDMVDLKTGRNVSEEAKSAIRLASIEKLGVDNMVVYKPENVKNTITVITDIYCHYCRLLHKEIPAYMENDVQVRYIFMPLRGGAAGMSTTVSVWCADDQNKALDSAKADGVVEEKTCDNPIKEHLKVARELGVEGTPVIILENGQMIPGYKPVAKVVAQLRK